MSNVLMEQAKEIQRLQAGMKDEVHKYVKDFNQMILVEPRELLDNKKLEFNYRARLQAYLIKEKDLWNCFPEYSGDLCIGGIENVDYEEMRIAFQEWSGDSCDSWYVPIMSFTDLRELQKVALGIVNSINYHAKARKDLQDAEQKELRRKQYDELKKEFGDA